MLEQELDESSKTKLHLEILLLVIHNFINLITVVLQFYTEQ
jgi:hypothetical protein